VYLLTQALLLPLAGAGYPSTLSGRFVRWGPALAAVLEIAYVSLMALLGQASHYNVATPLTAALYTAMGVGAFVLTLAAGLLALAIWRQPPQGQALMRQAAVAGLTLTCVLGLVGGFVMSSGTSNRVGGGSLPGDVPVLGWSRHHGDQRVAHFLALHAVQALPLLALGLSKLRWSAPRARIVLNGSAGLYALFAAGLFVQALMGQPF